MRQLRYAGPGEDATHVVVEAVDGSERYTLVLDDALRAAARQELPRVAGSDAGSGEVSPRDIQTRVRGGASPEVLAGETGVPVDRVMRFAYPVLQERARVADEARRARARRASAGGEMAVFGEIVDGRLAVHGIEPGEVAWDSFRRPDGQWTVTAGWREGDTDRFAQWNFLLATRVISPLDETAADLLSDRPLRPLAVDEPEAEPDLADVTGPPGPAGAEDVSTVGGAFEPADPVDMTATGPLPTPLRLAAPLQPDAAPADEAPVHPSAGGRRGRGAAARGREETDDPTPRGLDSFFGPRDDADPGAGSEALPFAVDPAAVRRTRPADDESDPKAARARIPSWDDILLGVRRRTD